MQGIGILGLWLSLEDWNLTAPPSCLQVTSELWALYHDNLDSQAGALKQEQKQACLFIWAEEAELAQPALQWGGNIQTRMALFHLCSHTGDCIHKLAPASPPLAKVQRCTPQGWVRSHQCLFIGLFMANLDALSCYLAP